MPRKTMVAKKICEAQSILKALGLPSNQQNEISALTLLTLCGIKPKDSWSNTHKHSLSVSKGIINFIFHEYHKEYAPNTRETVRRQVLHQFCQAYLSDYNPDDPKLPTNSPKAHYALTESAEAVIKQFGTKHWTASLNIFISQNSTLTERYRKKRERNLVPILLSDGKQFELSPGKHNVLQAAIIQDFAPHFANGSKVLYLGDTAKKNLYFDERTLKRLGIPVTEHDKLPDIILFDEKNRWLFLIEAVTSHGPMSPKRVMELEELLKDCGLGKVFVSAFPDFAEFRRHTPEIAWETEVWLAEIPDHMIHYNGDKFFGPRTK